MFPAATFRRFLVDDDGPTASEYALMLAIIIVAAVGAASILPKVTSALGSFDVPGGAGAGKVSPALISNR